MGSRPAIVTLYRAAGAACALGLALLAPAAPAQSITRGALDDADRIRWDTARYALPEHTVCFLLPQQRGMLGVLDGYGNPRLRPRQHDFQVYAHYDIATGPVWRKPSGRFSVTLEVQVLGGDPGLDTLGSEDLLDRWLGEVLSELSADAAAASRARYTTGGHRAPDGRVWSSYENPYAGALLVSYQTALDSSDVLELSFTFDKQRAERDPQWLQRRRDLALAIVGSVTVQPHGDGRCGPVSPDRDATAGRDREVPSP